MEVSPQQLSSNAGMQVLIAPTQVLSFVASEIMPHKVTKQLHLIMPLQLVPRSLAVSVDVRAGGG